MNAKEDEMTQQLPPAPSVWAVRGTGLTKVYGSGDAEVRALNGVDVAFDARQFTAIMGPSGSGKSTLLHVLAGVDDVTSGEVRLGDTLLTGATDKELTLLRSTRVGFIFQSFNLLPMYTAEQNILLPLQLADRTPDRAWFDQLIKVLGLGERLQHLPSELSGGQQQRVAIARALITKPDVVFADEPTGNLDSRTGAQILSFLRTSVRELGQTVVMVTHDPGAAAYADRVVLLADGRVAGDITEPTADSVLAGLDALRSLDEVN